MQFKYNLGVVEDPRSPEAKARDYAHSKLAGAPIIEWRDKKPEEWKRYNDREQDGSLSCMAQGGAKAYEILKKYSGTPDFVVSAHPPYRSRNNFPAGGMYTQNLGDVYKQVGTNFESKDTSQWQNESQMNRDITVDTPFKIGGYAFPNFQNIDEIAEAIEVHGQCVVVIHANHDEWTPVPKYNPSLPVDFGHGICAVDYFMWKGEKAILLEDSTGHNASFDKRGARILTESFLKARCAGAIYFTLEVPQYLFTMLMKLGSVGNEVSELQKRMNRENVILPHLIVDGKFGGNTKTAVINYQKAHNLVADGVVGAKTRAILNA